MILRRPIPTHPFAVPPIPGTFGVWQVRRDRAAPLGYVVSRAELGASSTTATPTAETKPAAGPGYAKRTARTAPSRG
jgi:hypothetical protein